MTLKQFERNVGKIVPVGKGWSVARRVCYDRFGHRTVEWEIWISSGYLFGPGQKIRANTPEEAINGILEQ